jgi:hypothetical protein
MCMLFFCLATGSLFCLTTICCHFLYSCLSYYCSPFSSDPYVWRQGSCRKRQTLGRWNEDHMLWYLWQYAQALQVKSLCSVIQRVHMHACVCVCVRACSCIFTLQPALAQSMNVWYPLDKWVDRYGSTAKTTIYGPVRNWTLVIWSLLWHAIEWTSGACGI